MNWFYSLSRGKQIAFGVLVAHALLLFVLAGDYWVTRNPFHPKKIVVRTIRYQTPQPQQNTSIAKAPVPKTAQPPKTTPAKKAAPEKPIKKALPKPTASIKQPTQKSKLENEALLMEIAQNIDSIAAPAPETTSKKEIEIPSFNPIIHFSAEPGEAEPTEAERIASLLQDLLQLPEFGEVKVELKIDRFGRLESCRIVDSKSVKNEQFLKKALPEVQFPCLNKDTSLTIVFRNAI